MIIKSLFGGTLALKNSVGSKALRLTPESEFEFASDAEFNDFKESVQIMIADGKLEKISKLSSSRSVPKGTITLIESKPSKEEVSESVTTDVVKPEIVTTDVVTISSKSLAEIKDEARIEAKRQNLYVAFQRETKGRKILDPDLSVEELERKLLEERLSRR